MASAATTFLNPATNTLAGTWYLEKLLKRYAQADNPLPFALADSNAGRATSSNGIGPALTNSAAFINQIGFPGTRSYVRSVIQRFDHYRPIFPPKSPN